jgi:hypothetical protein
MTAKKRAKQAGSRPWIAIHGLKVGISYAAQPFSSIPASLPEIQRPPEKQFTAASCSVELFPVLSIG